MNKSNLEETEHIWARGSSRMRVHCSRAAGKQAGIAAGAGSREITSLNRECEAFASSSKDVSPNSVINKGPCAQTPAPVWYTSPIQTLPVTLVNLLNSSGLSFFIFTVDIIPATRSNVLANMGTEVAFVEL